MTKNKDAIAKLRKALDKRYSADLEIFPDFTSIKAIQTIPSPSAIINAVAGIGGFPRGRVSEIHGAYSTGKTTIATETVAAAQANDPEACALYLDYEHAWDAIYARKLGTDLRGDRLIFAQPTYFEMGADIAIECVKQNLVDMIVVDSAAAMTPKSELEGEMDTDGGTQKGTQSALMARWLAIMTKLINQGRKPAMVLINQTRANIQIGGKIQRNAPKEQAAGGNAIKFYTSLRLELEEMGNEGDSSRGSKAIDQVYTQKRVRITCVKNKLAPPFMRGQIVIEYGKGINNIASIGELAEAKLGIMSGAGFFNYQGDTPETTVVCRGRDAFQAVLKESPALQTELERKVLAAIKAEHAQSLGLDEIKVTGSAKELETSLVLDDNTGSAPTFTSEDLKALRVQDPNFVPMEAEEI